MSGASRMPGTASPVPDKAPRNLAESALRAVASDVQCPSVNAVRCSGPQPSAIHPKENAMKRKTYTLVGAGIGLALFLFVALLPSLLYGGYAGVLLASGIAGAPVKATLLTRALTVFGMALGVLGVGGLFAVCGAAAGAAVSMVVGARPEGEAQAVKAEP